MSTSSLLFMLLLIKAVPCVMRSSLLPLAFCSDVKACVDSPLIYLFWYASKKEDPAFSFTEFLNSRLAPRIDWFANTAMGS